MDLSGRTIDVSDALMAVKVALLQKEAKTTLKPPRTLANSEWPPNYAEVLVWRKAQLAKFEANPKLIRDAKAYYARGVEGCIAFINHWCDTHDPRNVGTDKPVWMPLVLFAKQEELVRFVFACMLEDQPGLVEKSRTMGASWVCVAISVWMWLFQPGAAIGWGSQDANSVDRIGDPKSIFFKLRGLIERLPQCFLPEGLKDEHLKQFVCYNPASGASIVGEVGDKIGRGGRTRIYFKDESAHYEHPEVIEASLAATTRVPIDISSVNGLGNVFHRKREAGLDWYPGANLEPGYTRIFVMDWSDSPQYDQKWYDETKGRHERNGLAHVFASEFDRNYAASVQGTIIPKEWLDACVDAHIKLGWEPSETKISALDIGDAEDGDRNAQSSRSGSVLDFVDEWVARDPGVTTRKAISNCIEQKATELQYDAAGGLGSAVKAEGNRLKDEGGWPERLTLVPWNAGGKVLNPSERVVPGDKESPRNKDFYTNLKAQAWWELRLRVYRTYQCVVGVDDGNGNKVKAHYEPEDLISISSKLKLLQKVIKELCQPTASKGAKLKLLVDKIPEGTKSPNVGDSVVMLYHPMPQRGDFANVGAGPAIFIGGLRV